MDFQTARSCVYDKT